MSKRGKVDLVSDDKADSPAPVRRSTRISLGQNLPSSPAPMAIKTRRGSANSSSEEKITVDANVSPKDKRKTRRTSTDEELKPAPLRSRRSSVSKVIEEEKASIPNSPGRRSSRLSSSSPSLDAPARRTRKSSQDTETVEIPARRTTRRSSTGIQESTIEEIVEKAKPVTRRRRSSSVDEQEENAKNESGRPKTKRLFNEDNHLEPIREQEQEIKEKVVEEEKHEQSKKLEIIQETVDDESVKIIADLNEALSENSSTNKSMSESVETEKCNSELNNGIVANHKVEEESSPNESPSKTMEQVNGEASTNINEQSITEERDMSGDTTSEQKPSLPKNSNNDVTNEEDNPVENPTIFQKNVLKIDEAVSSTVTVNDSCDIIKIDKKLNEKDVISSPGSDKENTSINIKRKRLSIKKLEEASKKEMTEKNCFRIERTPNNSICEPMDVDEDEDDIFSSQVPTKNQTPKKSGLNENIGNDIKKLENSISEAPKENGDAVNINLSIKENDSVLEGSFSHVNSSPDKESSLLLTESNSTRKSVTSSLLNENKRASTDVIQVEVDDDSESEASIKLVDTDDEVEAAKISRVTEEENSAIGSEIPNDPAKVVDPESVDTSMKSIGTNDQMEEAETSPMKNESGIASETSFNKTVNITDTESGNASMNKDDETNALEITIDKDEMNGLEITNDKEDEIQSVIPPEISVNQAVTTSDSELIDASIKLDNVEEEAGKTEDDSSLIHSETSTNPTLIIDSGLNASVLDESFNSLKNSSLTDKTVESNDEEQKESKNKLNSESSIDPNNEVITSVVFEKCSSPEHLKDDLKKQSEEEQAIDCSESVEEITALSGENIELSPHKSDAINLRKSLPKSELEKNDVDNIEPLNDDVIEQKAEATPDHNDSKFDLSMGSLEEDLKKNISEVIEKHCLNRSKADEESLKHDVKNENEISDTQKPNNWNENVQYKDISLTEKLTLTDKPMDNCSKENVDINKVKYQECNISKSEQSPCKKIILQKIEIVNISDVKLPNIEQPDSKTQEIANEVNVKSSLLKSSSRHSLSNDRSKNFKDSEKTRNSLPCSKYNSEEKISNTELSTMKTAAEGKASENEIHLISSDEDEVLTPKTEDLNKSYDGASKVNTAKIGEKKIKSSKLESLETRDSSDDQNISQNEESDEKKRKSQKRIEIMHRSGIDVEDEESSDIDEHNISNEFIDDMAEEVGETLSEEESDENEIKDIGESVLSSDSDEESSEDDYDLDDPFIDNDGQEELLSGEEYFLEEEKVEKPKKKRFKRIIQMSSTTSDEEMSNKSTRKSTEAPRMSIEVEKLGQTEETEQIRKSEFAGMIDSILKLSPGESSTPNKYISDTMNSSQITESSVILQETCSVGAAKSRVIIEKIQGVVDVFCKNINEPEGDISLNVSLNYKPPSNPASARNSLSMSFGNKDLDQSIKNTPNKSSRSSLNENRSKASISPQKRCEIVKIEDRSEKELTVNDSTKEEEYKNQHPIEVVDETGISKKRKRSKKKKSKRDDSSDEKHKHEVPVEKSNVNILKGIKRPAEQETCKTSPESKISRNKRKKHHHSDTKKVEMISKEAVKSDTKNVELREVRKENKSKRTRDVSESNVVRKKVKRDESTDIVSKDLKPTEVKKKSERRERSSQSKDKKSKHINELLSSKTKKTNEKQSEFETITIKEIKPKRTERHQKESANVGSSLAAYKTSDGNDHGDWDEEDIFIKPSAANNTISGFNLEKYIERDFKNRMIYDSLRNKRQHSAKPKRLK